MTKFEMGEMYIRRDNYPAELVHTFDSGGDERLVWLSRPAGGGPHTYMTGRDGRVHPQVDCMGDVLPPKQGGTVWVNVYEDGHISTGFVYKTREEADSYASQDRSACIEVQWEEGQGL